MAITVLAYCSLVLWLIAAAWLSPAVYRIFDSTLAKPLDDWRAVLFFVGLLFAAFNSRRILAPANEIILVILYLMSVLLGMLVLLMMWNGRQQR